MMKTEDISKKSAGYAAADLVKDGMIVGLGTGSTAAYFIERLGQRCLSGLKIQVVASSEKSLQLAIKAKIPTIDINELTTLDFTADGADEIDAHNRMTKGGGGALMREKIIAAMSREMVIIVDAHKLVEKLGKFPLAIEILPFAWRATCNHIQKLGFFGRLRSDKDGGVYHSDNGNLIYDITFDNLLSDPEGTDALLKSIPGVLETGLFFNLAKKVIIGYPDGKVEIRENHA